MKQISLDKLQAATQAELEHGLMVVCERSDGSYGVVVGKRCLRILRELEQSGLVPADIPISCLVLGEGEPDS